GPWGFKNVLPTKQLKHLLLRLLVMPSQTMCPERHEHHACIYFADEVLQCRNFVSPIAAPPDTIRRLIPKMHISRHCPYAVSIWPNLLVGYRLSDRVVEIRPFIGVVAACVVHRLPRPARIVVVIAIAGRLVICQWQQVSLKPRTPSVDDYVI